MKNFLIVVLLAFATATVPADVKKGGFGAKKPGETEVSKEKKGASEKKRNSYPFHGVLASVDSTAKTLTLEGKKKNRVILLTGKTRFFRDGVNAKLADGRAGERVTGTVRKNASGREEALTVRFGGKPAAKPR